MFSVSWEWDWSWMWLVTIVAYGFALFVVGSLIAIINDAVNFKKGWVNVTVILISAVMLAAGGVIGLNFLSGSGRSTHSDEWAGARVVAKQFGLQSGKAYPLVLGSRVGGTTVESRADGGIFSARAYVSTKPASAISVAFSYQNQSYILELPVASLTFVQSETANPNMRIFLHKSNGLDGAIIKVHDSGNKCRVHDLLYTCRFTKVSRQLWMSPALVRRGLSPIVSKYLDSATITLTPSMYKEILGTP